jgi:hypothetical protein
MRGKAMSDTEKDFSDSFFSQEEKWAQFAQTGALNEPSLNQLRDQIKKVMIPLLIKTFQCKLELDQSLSLPSRLQNSKTSYTPEEIEEQLRTLDNDLKVLHLWCQSCRSQIQKALTPPEEEQKNTVAASASSSHPAVAKSFNEAVSAQSFFREQQLSQEKEEAASTEKPQKTWWEKLFKNYTRHHDDRN